MSAFLDALQTRDTLTINGMTTNSSTLNKCVDLFFSIGAMRGKDKERLIANFELAFAENPLTAMRILFWARDVRGGAGERQIFRDIIHHLANSNPEVMAKNISLIPEYGRWDDVYALFGTKLDTQAKDLFVAGLNDPKSICAKWVKRKGSDAIALERYMKLSPKQYRKMLVEKTKVVEQLMCANKWSDINYEHVPSLAMARYSKAFGKHDPDGFDKFKNSDDKKVNASAVYPYDVIKTLTKGDDVLAGKQWKSLPNYMETADGTERIMPVCDVSGSMSTAVGGNKNLSCMDVCISLGMYISERNVGPFKDAFITFSGTPSLQILKGSLSSRYIQLHGGEWGVNTNLEAVFNLILGQAIKNNVAQSEMPTMILIMSDMEFDQATNRKHTAFDMIRANYEASGYTMPKLVFWNLNSSGKNFPVQVNDSGVALVSGFSPSILTSLLGGKDFSPVSVMDAAVNSPRYEAVSV